MSDERSESVKVCCTRLQDAGERSSTLIFANPVNGRCSLVPISADQCSQSRRKQFLPPQLLQPGRSAAELQVLGEVAATEEVFL